MKQENFWLKLQEFIKNSGDLPNLVQAIAERLIQVKHEPSLPVQLILATVCQGAIYLNERSHLNFPRINPVYPLSFNQQFALEMALSNSAIALISGSPATGKTRIATCLAHAAITHQKRVLILTHHPSVLNAYQELPGYPFQLSQTQNYQDWIKEKLRQQDLFQPQMDYLPLHLLPDSELAKLRSPAKLERWLPLLETPNLEQHLQPELPHLSAARLQLLVYQMRQLKPLLEQQLNLIHQFRNLSPEGITELIEHLIESPQIPILGTVREFFESNSFLWQTAFDLVIVEEAQYLNWGELMLLAGLTQKLVLLGDEQQHYSRKSNSRKSFFNRFPDCFSWLSQHLLPAYCCKLNEQFRLHPEIAIPVYSFISPNWVQTSTKRISYHFPNLTHRFVWQHIPNQTETEKILELLSIFDPQLSQNIGIITTSEKQRDWFITNCPQSYSNLFIETLENWVGQERAIVFFCCTGNPQNLEREPIKIALTRGQDYLILVGDFYRWQEKGSPLRNLEIPKEQSVVLS